MSLFVNGIKLAEEFFLTLEQKERNIKVKGRKKNNIPSCKLLVFTPE